MTCICVQTHTRTMLLVYTIGLLYAFIAVCLGTKGMYCHLPWPTVGLP